MGVPKFYRWLSERYPLVNQRIGKDTEFLPHFDNMYLDMNGIIHNCTHPNDEDVSDRISMKDMVLGMFAYVDRMVHIVRPQKVLMLAVDGCAPRAKMNQQRSRRFASAKERREQTEAAIKSGKITEQQAREQFDSNCITPGTEFMEEVSRHFQYFIRLKIKEDPLWRNLEIIYSGHDVPGEGEHKIMDYIRHTRMQPGYDPNLRHCLCGLDADLIMLGLASHEPHFALLREQVDFTGGRGGKKAGSQTTKEVKKQVEQDKWELLHLTTLRQYLDAEFGNKNLPFGYDLERVIDDFVLLCMLVGNDFLPHLPSMSIAEGGLDNLIDKYKELLPSLPGYITQGTKINFERLEIMMKTIGDREESVFKERAKNQEKMQRRNNTMDQENQAPFAQMAEESGLVTASSSLKTKYYGEKFGISEEHQQVHQSIRRSYIEGLQWCFAYYYEGVQSWTWFYPFHYAPMASDLYDLSQYKISLKKGQPFLPFLQLLSCLPADSATFLPECYRNLMTLNTSPIADFYPREFKVDMNGKVSSWEGVNLLPFIDERRLLEAVKNSCPDEKLTQAERDRNTFGHDIVFKFDMSVTSKVYSTFPSAGLPDIDVCNSSAKRYFLPQMDKFIPNLLTGTISDGRFPGDPQLFAGVTLRSDVVGRLEKVGLNCFGRDSRGSTYVLNVRCPSSIVISNVESNSFAEAILPSLEALQKSRKNSRLTVFVNYPNLREAEVLAVADEDFVFTLQEEKKKIYRFHKSVQTEADTIAFQKDAEAAESKSLKGAGFVGSGGLDIGDVDVMIKVRPLLGMEFDPKDGSTKQIFSDVETWVPYQLVCFDNSAPDPRLRPKKGKTIEERFPVNSQVMCLEKSGYGFVGTVTGFAEDGVLSQFDNNTPQIPPYGHTIAKSIVDEYIPAHKASKHLKIDSTTFGKIAGTLLVRPGRYDIGLNLKVGKHYIIPGYARSKSVEATQPPWSGGETITVISGLDAVDNDDGDVPTSQQGGWEFTTRALELIAAYKKKFPSIFKTVAENPGSIEYEMTDLFPDTSNNEAQAQMDKVCKWLEQLDTFRLPLVPTSSKTMSRDAIAAVQQASDDIQKQLENSKKNEKIVVKLPPHVLFIYDSSSDASWFKSPTSGSPPRLGDRVCNMSSPVVPFGLGGTVVATHASTGCVEVLFDKEFVGGTSLYGACGSKRGKLVPWTQMLNMSSRSPISIKAANIPKVSKPTPKEKKEVPKSTQAKSRNTKSKLQPKPKGTMSPAVQNLFSSVSTPAQSNWSVPPVNQTSNEVKSTSVDSQAQEVSAAFQTLTTSESVKTEGGADTELLDYFQQLEQARKAKKANRRVARQASNKVSESSKPKETPVKHVETTKSKEPVQKTILQKKPIVVEKQAEKVVESAAPIPDNVTPPNNTEEDEMEALFMRASVATGKKYKQGIK